MEFKQHCIKKKKEWTFTSFTQKDLNLPEQNSFLLRRVVPSSLQLFVYTVNSFHIEDICSALCQCIAL